MTVPCGGTGVSEENETQSVKPGDYESSDSGAFCFSAVRSNFDCPPVLQNRIVKEGRTVNILSGFIDLNDYRQPPASRWAQAPSHLQHPASLDSQREDAHSAGFLILLTRMAEKTALKNSPWVGWGCARLK